MSSQNNIPGQQIHNPAQGENNPRQRELNFLSALHHHTSVINNIVLPTSAEVRRIRDERNATKISNLQKITEILNRVHQGDNDIYEFHVSTAFFTDDSLEILNTRLNLYGWIGERHDVQFLRIRPQ